MSTAETAREQEMIYAEEIARGADSEVLAEIGFRPPETFPSSPLDMLAREAVSEEVEVVDGSTPSPEVEDVLEVIHDTDWQHRAHAEYLERQEPAPPKIQRPIRARRRPRLTGRARIFAEGRGTDPDLM